MSFLSKLVVVAAAALSIASVACHVGEESTVVVKYDPHTSSTTVTCSPTFIEVDVAKLKTCGGAGNGHGHCYDKWKVSGVAGDPTGDYADKTCADTEICVPDKVLTANGKKLQSCDFSGQDGVCMSVIAKQINDNKALLDKGACEGDDEVCTPCIDPRNGKPTGACDATGAHDTACTGAKGSSGISLCCHGSGICLDKAGIPGDNADDLERDVCQKPGQLCAPASLIDNKPVKCSGPLGLSGVCVDQCFSSMLQGLKAVSKGDCASPTELCVPCVVGKGQGLPGCE